MIFMLNFVKFFLHLLMHVIFFSFILKYFYWFVNVTPDLLSTTNSMQLMLLIINITDQCYMSPFLWITAFDLLIFYSCLDFCTYTREKSQARVSTPLSVACFFCMYLLGEDTLSLPFFRRDGVILFCEAAAPRAFFCDRPGHCHTRLRRNRMPVFAAKRHTTDLS